MDDNDQNLTKAIEFVDQAMMLTEQSIAATLKAEGAPDEMIAAVMMTTMFGKAVALAASMRRDGVKAASREELHRMVDRISDVTDAKLDEQATLDRDGAAKARGRHH